MNRIDKNILLSLITQRIQQKQSLGVFRRYLLNSLNSTKQSILENRYDLSRSLLSGPDKEEQICPNPEIKYEETKECPSEYDCPGSHAFDCHTFTCKSGYDCNEAIDFYCGLKNECVKDHDCSAGHGFFCTEDDDCTGGFTCSGGGADCDTVHPYNNLGGDTTPGDFDCGDPGGTPSFDCKGSFECEATDEFDCFRGFDCTGASADFDCGASTEFECGDAGGTDEFVCNTAFDCEGSVDCGGTTTYCGDDFGCIPEDTFECKADYCS